MKFNKPSIVLLASLFASTQISDLRAQEESEMDMEDMLEMSLEDLMGMEITSVSKKAERLQDVSSSIYVISQEDIQRSSATRFVDLLMDVPGFWSVSLSYKKMITGHRSSTDAFQGTILVLLDGVPLQSQYSSVFDFSSFDIPLDEIDRIEIIKGPGGTIYGANAATGVVNIFTKKAYDNEGVRVKFSAGNRKYMQGDVAYGKKFGEKSGINFYVKNRFFDGYTPLDYIQGTNPQVPSGSMTNLIPLPNDNQLTEYVPSTNYLTGGFKLNSELNENTNLEISSQFNQLTSNEYTLNIQSYMPYIDQLNVIDEGASRVIGNVRLDHNFSENHSLFVHGSYHREKTGSFLNSSYYSLTDLMDLEIQDNLSKGIHNFSFGINARLVNFNVKEIQNTDQVDFLNKENNKKNLLGGFIQDKVSLLDGKIDLIAGIKAERWSLVGNEFYVSPSFKFAIKPNEKHTIWGSYSSAVTTPAFIHTNIVFEFLRYPTMDEFAAMITPGIVAQLIASGMSAEEAAVAAVGIAQVQAPVIFEQTFGTTQIAGLSYTLINGEDTDPARYHTFELGYRTSAFEKMIFETNVFYSVFNNLIGSTGSTGFDVNPITNDPIIPLYYTNLDQGESMGMETVIKMKPTKALTLEFSHTMLSFLQWSMENQTKDDVDKNATPSTPEHVLRFKTYIDLPGDLQINLGGLYATEYQNGGTWDFVTQRPANFVTGSPEAVDVNGEKNDSRFALNAKITKQFMDGKIAVSLWGSDLAANPYVEYASAYSTFFPRQRHRIFGIELNGKF